MNFSYSVRQATTTTVIIQKGGTRLGDRLWNGGKQGSFSPANDLR